MTIQPEQIARLENGELVLLDQRLLPAERVEQRYARWQDIAEAIRTMVVRGAPAIGVAAAYGVAVAARSGRVGAGRRLPGPDRRPADRRQPALGGGADARGGRCHPGRRS